MTYQCLVILLMVASIATVTVQYDTCTDVKQNYQGYTYTIDTNTNEKVWSHCGFYNPKYEGTYCGFERSDEQHFVCDPDSLITSQLTDVDNALKVIQRNTSTLCTNSDGAAESYMVGIVLINRIRIPDLSGTVCINNCNELHPALDTTKRSAKNNEKNTIMRNFADGIRTGWKLGSCGNDVIVFYTQELNMLYISVGYKAATLVTPSVIESLQSTFASYKAQGRIADGLLAVAEELRKILRAVTPAHVLLIVNMASLVLVATILFLFLHIRDLDLNVWGREGIWKIVENVVYALSGAWVINALLYVVINMSTRAPFWGVIIAFLFALVLVVIYGFEESIFPDATTIS